MSFETKKIRFGLKPTKLTEGLGAVGEINSGHLSTAFGIDKPDYINMGYAQIFSATDRYHNKPMIGLTESKGNIKILNSNIYRWRLSGFMKQKLRVTQVVTTDPRPGLGQRPFEIVLDKPWFKVPDVIQGEDNRYQLRVMNEEAEVLGPNSFKYTVQLITNDVNEYFPSKLLQEGREFCKVSSAVADESNQDYGGFQFQTVFESEGQLGQFAVEFSLTDKAARKAKEAAERGDFNDANFGSYINQVRIPFMSRDDMGRMQIWTSFMGMAEAEMHNRIYCDVEHALTLGRASNYMVSAQGYPIITGSGLREQLESGNILEHNGNMTIDQLHDWFQSILKDKVDRGECKIVLSCGIKFAQMFDRMIKAESSSFLTLDSHFIRKGEDYKHMDFGSYFASYEGFIVNISVMLNPSYDNQYFQPKMHPVETNFTVDSWRADILDFGSTDPQGSGKSDPNISMTKEKYCDYSISHNGKWDARSGLPITDGGLGIIGGISGYSLHEEKSAGLMIADVSRCGAIYLALED
jgi:hypothetical protein